MPDLIDEYHNKKIELDNNTEEVIKKYIELTPKDVKTNFSIPIVERDKELGKLMRALELTIDDFEEVKIKIYMQHKISFIVVVLPKCYRREYEIYSE